MKNITKSLGLAEAKRDIPSPLLKASFFSKFTLWWLNNHLWRGFKRPLNPSDIYTVVPDERAVCRALKLERSWQSFTKEEKLAKNSLLKATVISNWQLLSMSFLLILIGEICKFAQPFLIAEIVSYFKGKYVTVEQAWGYAAGMVVLMLIYSLVSAYGEFLGQVAAMRMRSSSTALLSRKATRLSSRGLSEISQGTVINLLATDVEKFYNAALEFKGLFVGPVVLLLLLIIMAISLGLSILPALGFVVILTAIRLLMGNKSATLRRKMAEWSDQRILLITELVSNMRTVKAYCWEKGMGKNAHDLRREEIKEAGWVMFINGLNLNLGHACDRIVTFFLILTFVLRDNVVDYKMAVQILTWMKMGQIGFLNFPIGFSMWKQMEASVTRIQAFLNVDEYKELKKRRRESSMKATTEIGISMKNASFTWTLSEKNMSQNQKKMKASLLTSIASMSAVAKEETFVASGAFSLTHINMDIRAPDKTSQATLVAIVGPTGSGKSSLILSILGSLPLAGGVRSMRGKVAYVPQQAWIRGDTLRNNILMGEPLNRKRYSEALRACALHVDIAEMADGDATNVGNKGSGLSGGQRARISLARAVYRDADIYLFDDPFSALGIQVTSHIFNECLLKLLKGKIIIFSTSNVQLLGKADKVVVLGKGKMLAFGTPEEIKSQVNLEDLISDQPSVDMITDNVDFFAKQDKENMFKALFGNKHIKMEHAHIPKKRATPFNVYYQYWKAGYGAIAMTIFCLCLLAQQVFSILGDWWLVYILAGGSAKKYKSKTGYYPNYDNGTSSSGYPNYDNGTSSSVYPDYDNGTSSSGYPDYDNGTSSSVYPKYINSTSGAELNLAAQEPSKDLDQKALLGSYAIFVWTSLAFGLVSVLAGSFFVKTAAKRLYNAMFIRLLKAPMKAFSGDKGAEMVNRLARDTGRMDDIIPITVNVTFITAAIILTSACYICASDYYIIVVTIPFLVCLTLFVLYCIRSIRDTKRLESEFRTPTFEHLQHLLSGIEVVRAFGTEGYMIREADTLLDRHTAAWHMYIGSMYWMKMRLNLMVSLYLSLVLIIALCTSHTESTPFGLSLAYILVFMARVQYFATYTASLDANMTSVEHVYEYAHLAQEPELPQKEETWPKEGQIRFINVSLVYPESRDQILRCMSFNVEGGEKIGIIGRTGTGKTTIFNAALRLYNHTGTIRIDGLDNRKVSLTDLRKNTSFLLQDPLLHLGSLRFNLDPYSRFTDDQIWSALDKVGLKKMVGRLPGKLDAEVEVGGGNFSCGQRQLICMANALLHRHKIMFLDEITADVDITTAKVIDKLLLEEFHGCTVLNITHRIVPLMVYDKIMVVEMGKVAEFDHPHLLLQDENSMLYSLVQKHGPHMAKIMTETAKDSYDSKFFTPETNGATEA